MFKRLEVLLSWLHVQDMPAYPVLIAYALAAVLLTIFFIFEDAPFHRSHRIEKTYVHTVMALVFLANLAAGFSAVAHQLRIVRLQLLNMLLIVTLVLIHISFRPSSKMILPTFGSHMVKCQPDFSRPNFEPTPCALRMAKDMNNLLRRLFKLSVNWWGMSDLGVFLLIILCNVCTTLASLSESFIAGLAFFEWFGGWLLLLMKGMRSMAALLKSNSLVVQLNVYFRNIVRNGDAATLEYVLEHINVGSLMEVVQARTKDLLCNEAVERGLLSTRSKAILVDALQKSGLAYNSLHEYAVRSLILSTPGQELTKLKTLLDARGTYHNLFKLIYTDITTDEVREEILAHFAQEALQVREQLNGGSRGIKILSDVDDTLLSSGGIFPAGCHKHFPKHVVYPGCLALFEALDSDFGPRVPSCNLVFLSARPHIYKGIAEDRSYVRFRELVEEQAMHTLPTLLPGHKTQGLRAVLTHVCKKMLAWRHVGELKYRTYVKFVELYREYDFVFFGDNGQGDLLAGQLMTAREKADSTFNGEAGSPGACSRTLRRQPRPRLRAVVIHEVAPIDKCLSSDLPKDRDEARQHLLRQRIILHRSYVGSALALHRLDADLVSAQQLADVAKRAMREFEIIRFTYPDWSKRLSKSERYLRADLELANQALREAGMPPLEPLGSSLEPSQRWSMLWNFEDDHFEDDHLSISDTSDSRSDTSLE